MSKDLFDESTMTFGEHLECLREHLIKAIFGLVIFVVIALFNGGKIVDIVRSPIDSALREYAKKHNAEFVDDVTTSEPFDFWKWLKTEFGFEEEDVDGASGEEPDPDDLLDHAENPIVVPADEEKPLTIEAWMRASDLYSAFHKLNPEAFPEIDPPENEQPVKIAIASTAFIELESVIRRQNQAVTLTVQEAFLTYLKVAFLTGLLFASPWVFYQLWLFVAAGLYPHERKYVYTYLPMSIVLFSGGALFCFFAVFPFVLKFLLGFNAMLDVQPQIRLSEWISFAVMLPLMFGISFQLPLVMLFLERISVFEVTDYREKRRMAVLVIAFLSMIMTPADPMSMLMMMFPLILLYELGIGLCLFRPSKSDSELQPV